jgi:hypothetical protein
MISLTVFMSGTLLAALPQVRAFGLYAALSFAALIFACVSLGRIAVFGVIGYAVARLTSPLSARIILSVVFDSAAIWLASRVSAPIMWSTIVAIAVAECIFWSPELKRVLRGALA